MDRIDYLTEDNAPTFEEVNDLWASEREAAEYADMVAWLWNER